jgi:peptidoglycan/xylan/chitin deacetylase (PgdA/CDA1 family)
MASSASLSPGQKQALRQYHSLRTMRAMVELSLGLTAGASGFLAYAVRGRSASIFGPSVYHGPRNLPILALTFDDGPSESTPQLLEILERHSVPASFFMCGANVRRCPGIAREVRDRGHEIGNHTDTHPYFHFKSARFIHDEMARAQDAIRQASGVAPAWFRAPYGVRWFGVGEAQRSLALRGVMWTTIARDWRWPADRVAERLVRAACPGAILCLHDGRVTRPRPDIRDTIEAVRLAIPRILDRGLRFATLTQMFGPACS